MRRRCVISFAVSDVCTAAVCVCMSSLSLSHSLFLSVSLFISLSFPLSFSLSLCDENVNDGNDDNYDVQAVSARESGGKERERERAT